jgi:hypothetical protein
MRTPKSLTLAIACWIQMAALAPAALADDSAVKRVGGTITALDAQPTIELVAEYVRAWVDPAVDSIHVECVFLLRNHGPEARVLIGFPESAWGDAGPEPFLSFRSFANGEEVQCTREPSAQKSDAYADSRYWWTKEVVFGAGELKAIRDVYDSRPGDTSDGSRWFAYTLATGGNWTGPIGSCDVVVSVRGDSLHLTSRPPASFASKGEIRWHFAGSEPDTDGMPGTLFVEWKGQDVQRRHGR